jgi:RNA polymerase sigma factor (TIGR02999 family)
MVLRAENVTEMLRAVQLGDPGAVDVLMEAVYTDLKLVARRYMSAERAEHTLQPTAIIDEVFLRMFKPAGEGSNGWRPIVDWRTRAHFLGIAATKMRQVLVDHARQKRALKRNFGVRIEIADVNLRIAPDIGEHDLEVIDRLLNLLASKDPQAAKVVELKFFGNLTDKESAEHLRINIARVRRDWAFARSWLRHRMPNGETT